jgi:plasmid stability protein
MPKMIQIRNVPDRLHRTLKARASMAGRTLSDYLLEELARFAELPTTEELIARLPRYSDVLKPSPAEIIRRERDRR